MSEVTLAHRGSEPRSAVSIARKSAATLYALIAYCAFFGTILYAIVFVGNLPIARTIDSVPGSTSLIAIVINISLLGLFAVQHSVMARPFFKRWITRWIPQAIERSTFVLLSSLALLLVFWQWQPMTEIIWQVSTGPLFYGITAVYVIGWIIVFSSSFMINHFELFGLKQVYDYCRERVTSESPFTVRYFYAFVRHPLMLGFLIAMWAAPTMTTGHLLFSLVTTLYIVLAVKYLEERDLRRSIGEQYEKYQQQVPMLVPRLTRR